MWKKIIAVLMIITGVLLIFSNQINEQVLKYRSQALTREVTEVSATEMRENNERRLPKVIEEEIYDFSQVEEAGLDETWSSLFERAQEDPLFAEFMAAGAEFRYTEGSEDPNSNIEPDASEDEPATSEDDPELPVDEPDPPVDEPEPSVDQTDPDEASSPPLRSPATEEEAEEALKKFTKSFYIGVLKIPRINLELGILRGVRNNNLWVGSGTMRSDQVMGERNYPIAGHHMRAWEVLFNRVPELKPGHLMYMTDKENIYTYRVYQNKKVHESDIGVIYDLVATRHGSPVLTLVTCFHRDEPEARVIIHGELIEVQPYSDAAFRALD